MIPERLVILVLNSLIDIKVAALQGALFPIEKCLDSVFHNAIH